jgi:branched-chain amino acid transport system substrate-binding protein
MKVGVIGPFSGSRQAYGDLLQKISKKYQHSKIEYIFVNDEAKEEIAIEGAKFLVTQNILLALGHFNSLCALATIPIYTHYNIPLILPCSTNPKLDFIRNVYCLAPNDIGQAKFVQNFIKKGFVVISDNSKYSKNLLSLCNNDPTFLLPNLRCNYLIIATHNNSIKITNNLLLDHYINSIIYTDDCLIEDFIKNVDKSIYNKIKIIGPNKNYEELINFSFEIIMNYAIHHYNNDINAYLSDALVDHRLFWTMYEIKENSFLTRIDY